MHGSVSILIIKGGSRCKSWKKIFITDDEQINKFLFHYSRHENLGFDPKYIEYEMSKWAAQKFQTIILAHINIILYKMHVT